ncbi:MAG TPA: class I SAM-dependent methyltransferase [Longimicrobium sp.]|nr:class I SAM-dependent methyltransferase [Longimicrobium sp.]
MPDPPPTSRSVRGAYQAAAGAYDARWARYNRETLGLLRPWLAGRDLGRLVDVGCGTANLLAALTAWDAAPDAYVGVDLAPEMLRVARGKVEGVAGVRAGLVAGEAGAIPLAAGGFDTAVAASTLHGWDDAAGSLAEVRRVLRSGGTLLLLDWHRDPLPMRILNAAMRIRRIPYRRMYDAASIRALLGRAGFVVEDEGRRAIGAWWRVIAFRARAV